jgi:hypothetical protein
MSDTWNRRGIWTILVAVVSFISLLAAAQEKKEYRCTVGPRAVISITNNYGPVTVGPSGNNQVVVTTLRHADNVSFLNEQHGNRIELRAESKRQGTGLADYTVLVPTDALVSLHSLDGRLHAQGLRGDVILEGSTAFIEVSEISDAHVHVKTLGGPVMLTAIRHSHVDVHSVTGNVNVHNVTESSVTVYSGSGQITYDGDPGDAGDYVLTSHTGDLDVSIPATASVEIKAHSKEPDQTISNLDNVPTRQKNHFAKPGIFEGSRFVLRSFKGKVRIHRPDSTTDRR